MIAAVNLSTTSLRAAMGVARTQIWVAGELTPRIRGHGYPHNQTFAIAIQLGVTGTLALWAMWPAHFLLFRSGGITAWLGTVIVVDNVVCSTVHSHLFDFNNGWLYVFGVGVLGGTVLQESATTPAKPALSREHPGSNPSVLKRLSCPPVDWQG